MVRKFGKVKYYVNYYLITMNLSECVIQNVNVGLTMEHQLSLKLIIVIQTHLAFIIDSSGRHRIKNSERREDYLTPLR